MLCARLVVVGFLVTLPAACKKPPAPTTSTHTVGLWMNGERRGEEVATSTIEQHRSVTLTHTEFSGPPAVRLDGELLLERGRATMLRVTGAAPESLAAVVNVSTTPDRTDTFPIRGPFPIHVLSALVRQSIGTSRRTFAALPQGTVTVQPCPGAERPFTDATCHAVTGLASGAALVWLDRRRQLAAAVAQTPWGVVVATPGKRDAAHAALLERFDVYSEP